MTAPLLKKGCSTSYDTECSTSYEEKCDDPVHVEDEGRDEGHDVGPAIEAGGQDDPADEEAVVEEQSLPNERKLKRVLSILSPA